MRSILVVLCLLFVVVSCTKDDFTTKPQLKVTDVNASELTRNDDLRITMRLTDKEGDFSTFLGYSKNDINCPAGSFADSTKLSIPQAFLDAHLKEGDVVIDLEDVTLKGDNVCLASGSTTLPLTDTVIYSFWTKDQAGNVSDTARTQAIIIHP